MARHIQSIIELTSAQTKEFLDSLQNPKKNAERDKAIKKALKTNFNTVF